MLFDDFSEQCLKTWNRYFSILNNSYDINGREKRFIYPTILLCTNYREYYTMELLGASKEIKTQLQLKKSRAESIYQYFDLFPSNNSYSVFKFDGYENGITNICISNICKEEEALKRFKFIELYKTILRANHEDSSLVSFGEKFENCFLENSSLLCHMNGVYRCKNILFAAVFAKKVSRSKLNSFFISLFDIKKEENTLMIQGVYKLKSEDTNVLVASQLQRFYISRDTTETKISFFLKNTPEIFERALLAETQIYEPFLEWKESDGDVHREAMNPDFIVRHKDGSTSIVELKTARIDKRRLIKGKRNRRQVTSYISEGISQLFNYELYFKYRGNRDHIFNKYGIYIENPNLILIVGSVENINDTDLSEALLPYKEITIIDYDTLVSMYLMRGSIQDNPT